MGRSVLAIAAGFFVVVILSLVTDEILHLAQVYPPWGQPMYEPALNALALSYRIVYTVLSGYVTARLAPRDPMRHVVIGGLIGTVLGIAGVAGAMKVGLGPIWYPVAIALTGFPSVWLGGLLFVRSARVRQAPFVQ
jgi:hypothetical protein